MALTDAQAANDPNNGPGSLFDPTSTFTGPGTDPRYLPGGSLNAATLAYSGQAPAPVADPYAQWGGKQAYDSLASGYQAQDQTIHSSSNDAAQGAAQGLHGSILDYLYQTQKGQNAINEQGYQSELARKQGSNSILDMINQGVNSGGVMLANKNAGSSSASEAIARAYAKIGQRQNTQVGQQYDNAQHQIGLAQEDLQAQRVLGKQKIDLGKQQNLSGIVNQAQTQLAALDAQIASANMPQRIQIEQEKQQIHDQVMNILNQFDPELQQGDAAIQARGTDQNRALAFADANKVAATNPYNYTSNTPAQFADTGPFASDLPLFTSPTKKSQVG